MLNQQLTNAIANTWQYHEGLRKHMYRMEQLPKTIDVLAATDDSMIIKVKGYGKFYVSRDNVINATVIEATR
jgi:hypothetical protein